jgi:hypothetical protein
MRRIPREIIFQGKNELYPEVQGLEIPRIPRIGKVLF